MNKNHHTIADRVANAEREHINKDKELVELRQWLRTLQARLEDVEAQLLETERDMPVDPEPSAADAVKAVDTATWMGGRR